MCVSLPLSTALQCQTAAYLTAAVRGALWAEVRFAVPQPGGTTVAWLDGAAGERERQATVYMAS